MRNFLINLGVLALVILLMVIATNFLLNWYTHKGESLTVPDFRGRTIPEAAEIAKSRELQYLVNDTTFSEEMPRLAIVEQNPHPGSKVKRGRKVYFSINSSNVPKVTVPEDVLSGDMQYSQAMKILESYGLRIGQIRRVPGIAENVVKEIRYKGLVITPGMKVDKGSALDLYLEDGGKGGEKFPLRDFTGLPFEEAVIILRSDYLNLGEVFYSKPEVNHFKGTRVYKQNPSPGSNISQGQAVDFWVTDSLSVNQ